MAKENSIERVELSDARNMLTTGMRLTTDRSSLSSFERELLLEIVILNVEKESLSKEKV